jgi:type III secretory pathway component EscR
MKKGVVLLITLFFIMIILAIIAKNLEDTDEFMDEVGVNSSLSQLNITINNVNTQIMKIIKKIDENGHLDDVLSVIETIPLSYGNVKVLINLEEYSNEGNYNLNDVNLSQNLDSLFVENVLYQYDFFEVYLKNYRKEYGKFTNLKQVNYFLNEYQKETRDDMIHNIKDNFTYVTNDSNSTYLNCNYTVDINNIKSDVNMIFTADGKIADLDISFKY